jgi:hypothetical protein
MVGLKCAIWTGGTWNIMIVEANQSVGRQSSLALDSLGRPHISYDDDANGNLKYASWKGSVWNIEIVDRNKHIGLHSSLALDPYGNPHISYEDNAVGNLIYAYLNASMWNLRIVDQIRLAPGDLGAWGFPTSLALDETGTAHISYTGYTRHDLKYALITDFPSFLITFKVATVQDLAGKVLEVDSVEYTTNDLPKLFVWREGSNHSFKFAPAVFSSSRNKLDWHSTSGLTNSQSGVLTISKEGSISADYGLPTSGSSTLVSPSQEAMDSQDFSLHDIIGLTTTAVVAGIVVLFFVKRKMKRFNLKKERVS